MPTPLAEIFLAAFFGLGIGLLLGALLGGIFALALTRRIDHMAAERGAAYARDIIATREAVEPPSKTERRAIDEVLMTLTIQRERLEDDMARLTRFTKGSKP